MSLLFASCVLAGCAQTPVAEIRQNQQSVVSVTSSQSQMIAQSLPANVYDANAIVGNKFGEMTLKKISAALEKRPVADNNLRAEFSGDVAISGQYQYVDTDEGMFIAKGSTCFMVKDPISLQKLPVGKFDEENNGPEKFFCFSNNEKAQELLGKVQKETTITISSYEDTIFEGEGLDSAVLKSVQE